MNPLVPADGSNTLQVFNSPKSAPEVSALQGSGPLGTEGSAAAMRAAKSEEFEEILLKQFVEKLLPKDCEAFYGKGPGAGIWRSMMADGIAHQLALRDLLSLKPL